MIKVIVVMTTYNLDKYIEEALNSVLCQITDFEFKILIGDDASFDNTVSILQQYKKQYPNKIELRLSEKNLGSLQNSNRLFDHLESQYFAFLDGDDIWLDKYHLQKQVDFLDKNPEYSICAGNTQLLINDKPQRLLLKQTELNRTYTYEDMLKDKMPFFHVSSLLIRNTIYIKGLPECYMKVLGTFEECAIRGEDFRRITHLQEGKLYAMNCLLSYYRIHDKGLWQGSSNIKRTLESVISYNFLYKYFMDDRNKEFYKRKTNEMYKLLMKTIFINNLFLYEYSLLKTESSLFTALLNDLSNSDNICHKKLNTFKKCFLRVTYHILRIIVLREKQ